MSYRPLRFVVAALWPLFAITCSLTAPADEELVGSCEDDRKNGDETGPDCGGSCGPCGTSVACKVNEDCASGVCELDVCKEPECDDGVKNGDEADVDCGASLECFTCESGKTCNADDDCDSYVCSNGECAVPACDDGEYNGAEGDIDCGVVCPLLCADGLGCNDDADCASGLCDENDLICMPSPSSGSDLRRHSR
ncbi:hypothetical protein [Chondromyces apiculatus]|uniref:Tryptophan synthase alpha chain n=1 Tax=Chondromyces apiculatus DSM 436 TaxID=1192034 RepID=A0A017TAN2_9BACT|nr:hypothetical protein [Chondromyces apiculatus]EYF06343.1 Hypothetical protein CAP_1873 [Chondromyces apiculatus DSM 436]